MEKTMAELQETQQEKEARWAAQRATSNALGQKRDAARARARTRNLVVIGAIVVIAVLFVAIKLL
jgi:hypothetical protein